MTIFFETIYTDIISCNIEEPQQKYCLGTVSNRSLGGEGGGGLKHVLFYGFNVSPIRHMFLRIYAFSLFSPSCTSKHDNTVQLNKNAKKADEKLTSAEFQEKCFVQALLRKHIENSRLEGKQY